MKFAYVALIGVVVLSQASFAGDKKKWSDAQCQEERTRLNELQDADLANLGMDEATRQKKVDAKQAEISAKCPAGPH
jgi:hypothetical protein